MLKVEIIIGRDTLHYILEKLATIDLIEDITVIPSESLKPSNKKKFDTINTANIEFVVNNNVLDNILHLLLTDPKIQNGRINIIDMTRSLSLAAKEIKKVKIVQSTFIRASRNDVYSFITDYQNLPNELPEYIKSIDIVNSVDNTKIIEEELSINGIIFKQLTKHVMYYPAVHDIEILSGYLEGSRIVETFTDIGNGTEVMIICDFVINKELEKILGSNPKERLEDSIRKVISRVNKIIENKFVINDEW